MVRNPDRLWKSVLSVVMASLIAPFAVASEQVSLVGLNDVVNVNTPPTGVPSIVASNQSDLDFMNGYVHARDRFWQMDFLRRAASGTFAELVGTSALASDIELRTLGVRRAAWRSYTAYSASTRARLQHYANGVNAWLGEGNLPPEYGALELTQAERWSPVDSVAIAKLLALQLSFGLEDIDATITLLTYQAVGQVVGFSGTALFLEDTHRVQPPDTRVTVPGFLGSIGGIDVPGEKSLVSAPELEALQLPYLGEHALAQIKRYRERIASDPLTYDIFNIDQTFKGSNEWAVSGTATDVMAPFVANDPHLGLDTPAIWYPIQLTARDDTGTITNTTGVSFAGIPGTTLGCSDFTCWGATVNPIDDVDVYMEQLALNAIGLPSHTIYQGQRERLIQVFQTYFANQLDGVPDNVAQVSVALDAGGVTLLVPRRNNGPIVDLDLVNGTAISVQYTGWGPTMELEAFFGFSEAQDVFEFGAATELFDVGSQNFAVADTSGNIAYWTSAELPIREDLQVLMAPDGGIPPNLIRDGSGALMHEWMPVTNPQPNQSLPYEILPKAEMPVAINPPAGYFANANNDPVGNTLDNNPFDQVRPGGGLYYLNGFVYANGMRQGRIDRVLSDAVAAGPVSVDQMKALQANNQLLDAELMMPFLMDAWSDAASLGAWPGVQQFLLDPGVVQVFNLWTAWDFSTPTGIPEGYDPGDDPFALGAPSQTEIDASVAATVYSLWRSRIIANTIDGTLTAVALGDNLPPSQLAFSAVKNLLDNFSSNQGVGASGLPFFNVPDAPDPASARDFLLLFSVREALDMLASDTFADAFDNSTNVMDYRWGKLHRIVFDHVLNDVFSLPNGLYGLSTVEGLSGVARSGGFEAVDASSHSARADGLNEFMFGSGPSRRFVGQMFPAPIGPVPEQIIAGGQSGVLGTVEYANQLYFWLVNAYLPLFIDPDLVQAIAVSSESFGPP